MIRSWSLLNGSRGVNGQNYSPMQRLKIPTVPLSSSSMAKRKSTSSQAPAAGAENSSKITFRSRKTPKPSTSKHSVIAKLSTDVVVSAPILSQTTKPLSVAGEVELALHHLRNSDPLLSNLIDAFGRPTFESSNPPFISLARSIIYQQLATKAANSIYTRFISLFGGENDVIPDAVLSLSAQQLREIGVSGRKASYLHDLASKYRDGVLSDSSILVMNDSDLLKMLTSVKGIGVWSVHMFMIFSLHRPDVLPVGDLGVRKGVQLLYGLKGLPKPMEMEQVCEKWKPYSSVGSWYMWRFVEAKGILPDAAAKATDLVEGD